MTDSRDSEFIETFLPVFDLLRHYFSYRIVGLENIIKNGPSLVVLNHGVLPFHGFLLACHLIQKLRMAPRGLGADFLFKIPLVRDFFLKGGALNADPRNAEEFLRQGHCVMLAPGGIYEALVTRPGMKRIPWERRLGFVRIACKTGTPIVPTYCQGINEAYFNSKFLLKERIKILEKTRFSIPLFFGLGLLPFPVKLTHFIGRPVKVTGRRGEGFEARVRRVHRGVMNEMKRLRDLKV